MKTALAPSLCTTIDPSGYPLHGSLVRGGVMANSTHQSFPESSEFTCQGMPFGVRIKDCGLSCGCEREFVCV